MNEISCKELKEKIDRKDNFKLVFCMDQERFRAQHIPGSINFPVTPERIKNAELVKKELLEGFSPDEEIVVYCSDVGCPASVFVYYRMEELSFKNVKRFSGGLLEWINDGYTLEGEQVETNS